MVSRVEPGNRRAIGCLFGGLSVVLGLALLARSCDASPVATNESGFSGNILFTMIKGVGEAVVEGVSLAIDNYRDDKRKARELTAKAEREPGASVVDVFQGRDLEIRAYSESAFMTDLRDGSSTYWTFPKANDGYFALRPDRIKQERWTVTRRMVSPQTDKVTMIDASITLGWRAGDGMTPLVTIEHVHPDSFFPYSDALYAEDYPVQRLAAMLNAGWLTRTGGPHPLIVIDRREVLRDGQRRLAAAEDHEKARLYPLKDKQGVLEQRPIEAGDDVIFAKPDPAVRFDEKTKTAFDPDTGLALKIIDTPGRDDRAYVGLISKGEEPVAMIEMAIERAWRPDVGETMFILLNRVAVPDGIRRFLEPIDKRKLSLARLAPLINAHRRFTYGRRTTGNFIIRDGRDTPVDLHR